MKRLSEETLNAYADGALEDHARAEVEAQLQTDADARNLLEKLRTADSLAMKAFAAPMHEPPPRALVDAILGAAQPGASNRHALRGTRQWPAWSLREYAVPLAACLALAVGLAAGAFLGHRLARPSTELALGVVPGGSGLHRLLEGHRSGTMLEIDRTGEPARRLSVLATFRDRHARPCREVEVLPAGADQQAVAAAVACRDAAGHWIVEGATRLAVAPSAAGQQFEPSGVPEKDALEGLLMLLGAQRALEPAEEKALIDRGWKS